MADPQLVMIESRVALVTGLQTLRPRPSGLNGEWISAQSVTVESLEEGTFSGFSLHKRVVVLRYSEAVALLNSGEVPR